MDNGDRPAVGFQSTATSYLGLTKREYFAAAALQGLLAKPGIALKELEILAVGMADRLLTELEKRNGN